MKAQYLTLANDILQCSEEISLDTSVFGCEQNDTLLNRTVIWQLAKRRSGCHKTKTRSEVALNGQKPFKQKGTGRARQGSTKAVHMRKGGTVFGPVVRSHAISLPKKQRRLAVKLALSKRAHQDCIAIIDKLEMQTQKTKILASQLQQNNLNDVLFIYEGELNTNFLLSSRNIPRSKCIHTDGLNVYDILRYKKVVFSNNALKKITETLGSN